MLERIHIRGYKSLWDVDVRLGPLSVLFGPNSAGKSNFLDAIQFISRIPRTRSLKEIFEPPYRGTPLESLREGDSLVSARIVSDGTLRILGLLAIGGSGENPGLIGFEEPENGVHPRRIGLIAELLKNQSAKNSQVIVTTHSPAFLDHLPIESLLVVARHEGTTRIQPFGTNVGKSGVDGNLDLIDSQMRDEALAEEREPTRLSARVLRGDFDA